MTQRRATPAAIAVAVLTLTHISAGCATKLYQHPALAAPEVESATIHVLRRKLMMGSVVSLPVQFDGVRLLKMKNGTCATVYLQPGSYTVAIEDNSSSWIDGSKTFEFETEQMEFAAGKTYYLLVAVGRSSSGSFWTGTQMHYSHSVDLMKPGAGEKLRSQLKFIAVSPQR